LAKSKVEFLTLDFPPIVGGISRYLYEIINHMPEKEVRVTAVAAPGHEAFDAKQKFDIDRLKVPSKWDAFRKQLKFFAPFYYQNLLRKSDVSMILCGQAHYSLLLPAWAISRQRRIPFGVFTYGLDLLYPQTTRYRTPFNHLLRAADIVFADSGTAEKILFDLDVNKTRVEVIYPSVSNEVDNVDNLLMDSLRDKHGLAGRKCILTVGRLVERKGHDIVLQAMPQILRAVPDAHYLIVGKGEYEPRLRSIVHELGIEPYVTFTGYAGDEEVAAYYALCDVFTMISRAIPEKGDIEGFGIVYLEANVMGKPVVAGNSGGVPEAVIHEETGLLVEPTNVEEVSQAIIRLLQNPQLASRLGKQGQKRAVEEFTSQASATKVLNRLGAITRA
jgi:phosphatidylinositol alpha-1,6-mannosyltransferase